MRFPNPVLSLVGLEKKKEKKKGPFEFGVSHRSCDKALNVLKRQNMGEDGSQVQVPTVTKVINCKKMLNIKKKLTYLKNGK